MDVDANRSAQKWSRRAQIGRVLWMLAGPFFRFSPRPLWGWRRMILRAFGAKVGAKAHIYPTVHITIPWNLDLGDKVGIGDHVILYALGPIQIGDRATVSQRAHLCAGSHDISDPVRTLIKPPIKIQSDAWICAEAFIGPGVTVGAGSIAGARSVVMRDVETGVIVAGNPARVIRLI